MTQFLHKEISITVIAKIDGILHVKRLQVLNEQHKHFKTFLSLISNFTVINSQRQDTNQVTLTPKLVSLLQHLQAQKEGSTA